MSKGNPAIGPRMHVYIHDHILFFQEGNTPLHVACKNGHNDTAQLLIDSGADLNRQNRVSYI